MLAEIIRELIQTGEGAAVTSEQLLIWVKRVTAQNAQSAINNHQSK